MNYTSLDCTTCFLTYANSNYVILDILLKRYSLIIVNEYRLPKRPGKVFDSTNTIFNGVGTNFGVGVGEARQGPRAGDGVLGEGTASPSPPTRGFVGAL